MNSIDLTEHRGRRILVFSDTYGIEAGNGVARFLHDLRRLAVDKNMPLELVVPARDEVADGLLSIRAPAFTVPGYGKLALSMPLRHHRKTIERHIKTSRPDCIHVSTPGPFGCLGVMLAQRYRIPLVGIYHTDFPAYASAIIGGQLNRLRQNPGGMAGSLATKVLPTVWRWMGRLSTINPRAPQDIATIGEVLNRNFQAFANHPESDRYLCSLAEDAATAMLRKFYACFDLVLTRSTAQQDSLGKQLRLDPQRIHCLLPGTDVERFHPDHADRSLWSQFGIPEHAMVVLYVGRITAEKNIGFLHEVWSCVQASQPERDVRLVIVGHGEANQIARFRALEKTHVIGSHAGQTLSQIYASSDLVVFPSTTETLGQVGLEAGASGVPVIVADQGGPQMYVENGQTGWVLPTDDPAIWVRQIVEVAKSPDLQSKTGSLARKHIASRFTLDHSLGSYWSLHETAIQRRRRKPKKSVERKVNVQTVNEVKDQCPHRGVMVISDFHAGKRYGNPIHRNLKKDAIRSMLELAKDRNLDLVLGGDFGDHGSRVSRLEADFEAFRRVRDEVGFGGRPIFVRGNHDYGFTDQRLEELTGGCQVHKSLVYFQPEAQVTVCHGHIFGLARTLRVIQSAKSLEELTHQLSEEQLDEDLKPAVIAYDIANMIESGLATHGLRGLSTAWEGVYHYRAMLAEQILKFASNSSQSDEATWKMIAGLVGTHDNVQVAAMLGIACGGWASLFGHTHEPLTKRKFMRLREKSPRIAQVVGNSGHINRKLPTCAVAEFPSVSVFQYESKTGQLRTVRKSSLNEDDIRMFGKRASARSLDQHPNTIRTDDGAMISEGVLAQPSPKAPTSGVSSSHGLASP